MTIVLDLIGYGMMIPIVPVLLTDPHSPHYLLSAGMPKTWGYLFLGLLTATFPLAQFFSTPILGNFSDRLGRRPVLITCLLGIAVSFMVFALGIETRNLTLLFLSRLAYGIASGVISTAQAAIADLTPPADRTRRFGLIGAAVGVGLMTGPFLGGILSNSHWVPWFNAATPFWAGALLSGLNGISAAFFLPETSERVANVLPKLRKSRPSFYHAFLGSRFQGFFRVAWLYHAGFAFYISFLSVVFIQRFGFNPTQLGAYFGAVGTAGLCAQFGLVGLLARKFSERQIIRTAMPAVVGLVLGIAFAPQAFWVFLLGPSLAIVAGLIQTNLTAWVSRQSGSAEQGEILGTYAAVQALAMTLPPLLSGFLAGIIHPVAPMLTAAGCVGLAILFFGGMLKPVFAIEDAKTGEERTAVDRVQIES
jgi:DHA1 family tetracycline resistance protein-like MFS transporter